jgi:hypothetical protein
MVKNCTFLFALVILSGLSFFLRAQTITSITTIPSNPTTSDIVYVLVECSFPAAPCNVYTKYYSVTNQDIDANALHCVGIVIEPCSYIDTFKIPALPAGTYTFSFSLNAGAAPEPCTAGITPFDFDELIFTVSTATAIEHGGTGKPLFSIYPNPSNGDLYVSFNGAVFASQLHIVSLAGKELSVVSCNHQKIDLHLPLGMYYCYLTSDNFTSTVQKVVITGNE